jgi:putative bacteriocin precursor
MKKLSKKIKDNQQTIEMYYCSCLCGSRCVCTCGSFLHYANGRNQNVGNSFYNNKNLGYA